MTICPQMSGHVSSYLNRASIFKYLHVNFHDVTNMKERPISAVDKFLRASERLVVAAFFMICVSSDILLRSSPVRVTSKKAISCKSSCTMFSTLQLTIYNINKEKQCKSFMKMLVYLVNKVTKQPFSHPSNNPFTSRRKKPCSYC